MNRYVGIGVAVTLIAAGIGALILWMGADVESRMSKNIGICIAAVRGRTGQWPKNKKTLLSDPNVGPLMSDFNRARPFEIRLVWAEDETAEYDLVHADSGKPWATLSIPKEKVRRYRSSPEPSTGSATRP